MGVSRKAGVGSQGERQSKVVEQFAAGFVASSSATDAEKATQRDWDRSQLLAVKDDDAQVQIYNAYAERSNTDGEGKNSRRGLGSGGGGASSSSGFGRGMSFVKAGGAPAPAPAPAAASSAAAAATPALPAGWAAQRDAASGHTYYFNASTGASQWHAPAPQLAAAPPPPPPAAGTGLPPGWVAGRDPASGAVYYANPSTGATQWEPPQAPTPAPAPAPAPAAAAAAAAAPWAQGATVRVAGFPSEMADHDLREIFGSHGQIVSCVVERRAYANRHALLRFDQVACAEKAAAEMNGSKLRGSRLTVELVGGAPGGGGAAARRPGAPY